MNFPYILSKYLQSKLFKHKLDKQATLHHLPFTLTTAIIVFATKLV